MDGIAFYHQLLHWVVLFDDDVFRPWMQDEQGCVVRVVAAVLEILV